MKKNILLNDVTFIIRIKRFWLHLTLAAVWIGGAFYGGYKLTSLSLEEKTKKTVDDIFAQVQNGMTKQQLTNAFARIAAADREISSNAPLAELHRLQHIETGNIRVGQCRFWQNAKDPEDHVHYITNVVCIFKNPYDAPPKVLIGLNAYDMNKVHGLESSIAVTTTNFTVHIDAWQEDVSVNMLQYGWVALPNIQPID